MARSRQPRKIICEDCYGVFESCALNVKRCAECRNTRELKRQKEIRKKQKAAAAPRKKSVVDVVKELVAYNEAHGTHLTYGQYVVMTDV